MKKINILLLLLGITIILNLYFLYQNLQFPVNYVICKSGYTDCFVNAKFQNMNDCEDTREKGTWSCDSHDPKNIPCSVPLNSTAVSYCKD
jgi:hypothetical protein